mmetsp:Transcript_94450/g.291169  ORF Transcript_94450/g.291169 Transcript_94450/m.291169 type:complete len:294 (+) Transcript_94450:1174-2055(+)
MLLVVRDQVTEGEAVVGGHEVDGVARAPAILLVEVRAAADARGKVALHAPVALDEPPHRVAELAVPLREARGPAGRELSHEVPAIAAVPGLSDELHVLQEGVVHQPANKGRVVGDFPVYATRERGREVEAEAIDAHLNGPIAEAFADPLRADRVVGVDRVPAAGVVGVVAVGEQVVVGLSDLRQGVPVALAPRALSGVVEDHVEDHLDPVAVELPDHGLELQGRRADPGLGVCGKPLHGGEECSSGVTPIVAEALLGLGVHERASRLVELEDGQQLHAVHAEAKEVGDLLDEA